MTSARREISVLGEASVPAGASAFWCERAWVDGAVRDGVLLRVDEAGVLTEVRVGVTTAEAAEGSPDGGPPNGGFLDGGSPNGEPPDGAASAGGTGSGITADDSGASVHHLSGVVFPGGVNAHSHAFHRMLRGRTHADGGTFWTWREVMYDVAERLTPESYRVVARAVFAEMLAGGWTSVGEFHYVHHAPDGEPYGQGDSTGAASERTGEQQETGASSEGAVGHGGGSGHAGGAHAMELALAAAADDVGIRMRLLDTCYLTGAIGEELSDEQARFGDGDIDGYLRRHADLAAALSARDPADPRDTGYRYETPVHSAVFRTGNRRFAGEGAGHVGESVAHMGEDAAHAGDDTAHAGSATRLVTLGAAIHSVRAVPAADIARFRDLGGPIHIHLSEQPAENDASLAACGRTPTGVLEDAGVLSPALSPVHATHLTDGDIAALGAAGTTIVMCPSTEADLADGIGPALDLARAGATIALGSDQHVVLDALRELQGLEAGERLRSGQRGRFTPAQLIDALTTGGARSLDLPAGSFEVGRVCDLVAVDPASSRTHGSVGEQVVLAGTSADVRTVVTAGQVRVRDGHHTTLGDIGALYRDAYAALGLDT